MFGGKTGAAAEVSTREGGEEPREVGEETVKGGDKPLTALA
jgi:hypothetical protein